MRRALWAMAVCGLWACADTEEDATGDAGGRVDATRGQVIGDGGPAPMPGRDAGLVRDAQPPAPDRGANPDPPAVRLDAAAPPPPADAAPPPPPTDDVGEPPPPPPDMGAPPPPPPPPETRSCLYRSTEFDAAERTYDVMGASDERLRYTVTGLPAPGDVQRAVLQVRVHDADHPGTEGRIWVNGQGPFDIPANAAWDNQTHDVEVDVSGATRAGDNSVEFGSSATEARTFYRISRVALRLDATVDDCAEAPPPPPAQAVPMQIGFREAEYTRRHNWVHRFCDAYAFTASGAEHIPADCDGLYAPDGSRQGKAIFRFRGVTEATYEITIRSRHTENRNPQGALFVVDGEGRRISQRSDRDVTNDVWGRKRLAGDVEIVLDSTNENQSDSVIWVRIVPVGP